MRGIDHCGEGKNWDKREMTAAKRTLALNNTLFVYLAAIWLKICLSGSSSFYAKWATQTSAFCNTTVVGIEGGMVRWEEAETCGEAKAGNAAGLKTLLASLERIKNRAGVDRRVSLLVNSSRRDEWAQNKSNICSKDVKDGDENSWKWVGRLKLPLTPHSPHVQMLFSGVEPDRFKEFTAPCSFCFHGYGPGKRFFFRLQSMLVLEDVTCASPTIAMVTIH